MAFKCPLARFEALGACGLLLWGGLTIGVAFIGTPAKFLAPTLTLPVALDVGRHTFAIYNEVELVLVVALAVIALRTSQPAVLRALILPAAIVLSETFWLIPALDVRVAAILAGQQMPPSHLHFVYVAVEAAKTMALIVLGGRLVLLRDR
ncbi:hypothetical protein GCM10007874_22000 [Labrys miyagiensis]|uniref:DUF4149 domain-containing protein n=1 Tax=Labrys miyagiensis TaxID=346912 RepID=A0ABQ6CFX1_9HYPH|nr:hypothetical protein [Labrys miyagiensis]GLS19183.1 hypothetical protein GCM10007874_22000 [Labrys miyagiensis]